MKQAILIVCAALLALELMALGAMYSCPSDTTTVVFRMVPPMLECRH